MSMSMNFLHDLNNEWCQMWSDGVKYNVGSGQIIIWRPFGQTFTISSPSPAWLMDGNVSAMKCVSKKLATVDCFKVYNEQSPAPLLPSTWVAEADAEKSHPARSQGDHRYLISYDQYHIVIIEIIKSS